MSAKSGYTIRRAHKILGLVVGLQFLFWTASGLFFTIFPIEQIRGEHLIHDEMVGSIAIGPQVISPHKFAIGADEVVLKPGLQAPWYEVKSSSEYAVYDARDGKKLTPWTKEEAALIAQSYWKGEGEMTSIRLVENPPREAASKVPLWRVQFDGADTGTLWVYTDRAKLRAVRTTKWRIFDVLWRFHIMDVTGDDRLDSWWLKLTAFLGFTMVLFGVTLLFDRARKRRLMQ